MIDIICLLFPTFFSFKKGDENLSLYLKTMKYVKYNVFTNFIVFMIIFVKSDYKFLEVDQMFTISVVPKYMFLSCVVAYYLPIFLSYINSNFSFKIRKVKVKTNVKNKKSY